MIGFQKPSTLHSPLSTFFLHPHHHPHPREDAVQRHVDFTALGDHDAAGVRQIAGDHGSRAAVDRP